MKNVHLLPATESRLYYTISMSGYNLKLSATPIHQSSEIRPQHIYITSDEEIKEGDWVYCRTENRVLVSNVSYSKLEDRFKIILTTDPKLIADSVQAITNTFAEWFVKNPSCEEVEVQCRYNFYVGQDLTHYKIIIPKEEPKQETLEQIDQNNPVTRGSTALVYKKETLEEVAERLYPIILEDDGWDKNKQYRDEFIEGAKWQAERSCNEAIEFAEWIRIKDFQTTERDNWIGLELRYYTTEELFEQFKQK